MRLPATRPMPDLNDSLATLSDRLPRRRAVISLTPLIDVVFILLVFFMLASSFLDWRAIELNTSAAGAPGSPALKPLLLSVSEDQVRLNDVAMPLAQAIVEINTHLISSPDQILQVQPVQATSFQTLIITLDTLKSAGIAKLSLVEDAEWQVPP